MGFCLFVDCLFWIGLGSCLFGLGYFGCLDVIAVVGVYDCGLLLCGCVAVWRGGCLIVNRL